MSRRATLKGSRDYEFSADWLESDIPTWDKLIDQFRPARLLEIGSYEGRSACYLIENCAKFGPIEICCIDTWEGGVEHDPNEMPDVERRFDGNIEIAKAKAQSGVMLRKFKSTSVKALAALLAADEPPFDLVYVDGSHKAPNVLTDAVLAFELLRVGGLMIFDDYLWQFEAEGEQDPLNMPKPAIDAFINIFRRKLRIVHRMPLYQLYVEKLAP